MEVTTIGLDLTKRVFQVHGIDAAGRAILRRKLGPAEVLTFFANLPPCHVGTEALIIGRGRSAHLTIPCA